METKRKLIFEKKKGDRLYEISMPLDAPLYELYGVLFEGLVKTLELMKESANMFKPKEPQEIENEQKPAE